MRVEEERTCVVKPGKIIGRRMRSNNEARPIRGFLAQSTSPVSFHQPSVGGVH
jgi:hypothetical protein